MYRTGTNGNDVLTGTSADDFIYARSGDDKVYGKGGNDEIGGGAGKDKLFGGTGNDKVYGGAGDDEIGGDGGDDALWGGEDNDVLYGGKGNDVLGGGKGNDTFYSGAGNNTIYGGEGVDTAGYVGLKLSDLTVKQVDAHQFTITGKGFSDTVYGVEKVMIGDKTYNISDLVKTTPTDPGHPDPKPDVVEKTYGTLDARHSDDGSGTEMYFGDGNMLTNYNITTNKTDGVQVGLKVHEYRGADITPDSIDTNGVAHYTVDAGPSEYRADRGDVSFDFAALFNMNGDGKTTADYTTTLKVDIDPTDGVDYFIFNSQNLGPGNDVMVDSTMTAGWTNDDGFADFVLQNSGNFGFGFLKNTIETKTGQPWDYDGKFDIELSVTDGNGLVADTHIVIDMVDPLALI